MAQIALKLKNAQGEWGGVVGFANYAALIAWANAQAKTAGEHIPFRKFHFDPALETFPALCWRCTGTGAYGTYGQCYHCAGIGAVWVRPELAAQRELQPVSGPQLELLYEQRPQLRPEPPAPSEPARRRKKKEA